jgi:hypothetical protein
MKLAHKVTPSPYMVKGLICTPPVENSNPSGVALAGADGQGVCALTRSNPRFLHGLPADYTEAEFSEYSMLIFERERLAALLDFRRDWPLLAGRLSAMRAAA